MTKLEQIINDRIEELEEYKEKVKNWKIKESKEEVLMITEIQLEELDYIKEKILEKSRLNPIKCKNCGKEFIPSRRDNIYCKECAKKSNKIWYANLTEEEKEKRREKSKICMKKYREKIKKEKENESKKNV